MYVCKFFSSGRHSRKVLLENHSLQRIPKIPFADKVPLRSPHGSQPVGMPLVLKRLKIYLSIACKIAVS